MLSITSCYQAFGAWRSPRGQEATLWVPPNLLPPDLTLLGEGGGYKETLIIVALENKKTRYTAVPQEFPLPGDPSHLGTHPSILPGGLAQTGPLTS